jgi:hexosaminidase
MARVLALALALTAVAALPAPALAAKNPRPDTVPALRAWTGATGDFKLKKTARVVAAEPFQKILTPEVELLARDLKLRAAPTRKPRRGDIVLRIDRELETVGKSGYTLKIARKLTVTARSTTGLFYGGRTLLQLLKDRKAPKGRASDYPRYTERGLMIDNGRQFFTRAWLIKRIREMANLKLNLLHLHFSDNQGFRVESQTHPEIVSDPHLTRADVRALVRFATRHHLNVIPELDSPGHMQAALESHPELQLTNALGQKQPDKLDVTLPEARKFIDDLVHEYLTLFRSGFWHMGADEYLGIASTEQDYDQYPQLEAYADEKYGESANGKDAVLDFVDFVGDMVRGQGGFLRVWSDGIEGGSAVTLDPSTEIEWWENRASAPPGELMERGHLVQNAGWWPLYYVTGGPLESLRATEQEMYEDWNPFVFEGPWSPRWAGADPGAARFEVERDAPLQLGAQLNVWNDDPGNMSQDEIAAGIARRLKILAQKTWGSRELTPDYDEFKRRTR